MHTPADATAAVMIHEDRHTQEERDRTRICSLAPADMCSAKQVSCSFHASQPAAHLQGERHRKASASELAGSNKRTPSGGAAGAALPQHTSPRDNQPTPRHATTSGSFSLAKARARTGPSEARRASVRTAARAHRLRYGFAVGRMQESTEYKTECIHASGRQRGEPIWLAPPARSPHGGAPTAACRPCGGAGAAAACQNSPFASR
mmetsp:Transcript_43395/g.114594  ORF Transcript_43395/g.114594 Transcript_43395/m.114594 type:complete len:205 (+) Transcript_43395:222-836(+)